MLQCEWKHRKYQCFLTLVKKNTVNYSVFGHLTLKNHGICSGFCFSPRKNTVNNSNFAVFSCFSLFFELRWSAIHGHQILRIFFPTISTFGCFWSQCPCCVSPTMRCGRLPSRSDVNKCRCAEIVSPRGRVFSPFGRVFSPFGRAFSPLKNGLGSNISEETLVCPKRSFL